MRRTDLPIPPGHVGLGDAFESAYAKLERPERFAHDLERALKGSRLDLPCAMLESDAVAAGIVPALDSLSKDQEAAMKPVARRLRIQQGPFTHLGLNPKIVAREEVGMGRVERLMRDVLSTGDLRAYAYDPSGVQWGEIPDRDAWRAPNLAIPGLRTFLDPDSSRGPDVGGSPVFVEAKAFTRWLAEVADQLAEPTVRTGKRGRPSVVRSVILPEFTRRVAEGRTMAKITDEAQRLRKWFADMHPGADLPAVNTIKDALRPFYRE